ncbi:ATP-dependent nuclease [Roseateles sp. P5_E11]
MRATSIRLQNFRSFADTQEIPLSPITVLIGKNNTGKSSIIRGLHLMQHGLDPYPDVRLGESQASIFVRLEGQHEHWGLRVGRPAVSSSLTMVFTDGESKSEQSTLTIDGNPSGLKGDTRFPNKEPNHLVVPILARRKAGQYSEEVRQHTATNVALDQSSLAAKLARVSVRGYPGHQQFADACYELLGFHVGPILSPNGQRPGAYLPSGATLPMDQMGEGVSNIVHMLANLAVSQDKILLIEEPENDLHPGALKALLDLIIVSSVRNQFVISTHSNIVVRHLCAAPRSTLLRVTAEEGILPTTSKVEVVAHTATARIAVLEDLGYSFADFDLWSGWLILEEASAETLIGKFLIPWFAPGLKGKLRTVSAAGVNRVDAKVDDFHRLMVFLHLQSAYEGKAWVRVDGDSAGQAVVERLREKHKTWREDQIRCFDRDQFERYYPAHFSDQIDQALDVKDPEARRQEKDKLRQRVVDWLVANEAAGKTALAESAKTVITQLQAIEKQLAG